MYEELIKKLRDYAAARKGEIAELTSEAADAIEELSKQILEMGQVWKSLLDVHKINSKMVAPESVPTDSEWWAHYKALLELLYLPRWIPVSERLPEDDVAVLVTYIGHNSQKPQADLLAYRYDGTWLWVEDATSFAPLGDVECAVPITHWMPLPEPPKEEAE